MAQQYNNDSIKSLGILGGVRAKPSSIGLENHEHLFIEILANSLDEAREGFGKVITIVKDIDNSISVIDNGRGIPMDKNSDGEYSYDKVCNQLYASGKYSNNDENSSYQYSLGTNGIGLTGTNYTSDFFELTSYRDGYRYYIKYEKGVQVCKLLKEKTDVKETGTTVHFLPSMECFRGENDISNDFIIENLKRQSIANKGVKLIFDNKIEDKKYEFYYENGIRDYVDEISKDKNITNVVQLETEAIGSDNNNSDKYKIKVELTFVFNNEVNVMEYYHNTSYLANGGTPELFIKNAFVYAIDKYLKDSNMYNKSEKKISFDDVKDSLIVISNTFSTISLYSDQTKKQINSRFMQEYVTNWLKTQLEIYFVENKLEADKIAQQILLNKRVREKSEQTRLDIRKKLESSISVVNRVEGFIDCRSKDKTKRELAIVEGKSALGAIVQGRDSNFQAIFPIRGKILSCLKATPDKIFKNEIVTNIFKLLGCGVELRDKHIKDLIKFDISKLNFDKIVIMTDGDIDGYSIRVLLLTMFYRLAPTLIKEGKIYVVEAPLFEIHTKNKVHYAYNEEERDSITNKLKSKYEVNRNKGLGEMESEAVAETLMNPSTRKMIQITVDDVEKMEETFELFMGDDVTPRKEEIYNYFDKYEFID